LNCYLGRQATAVEAGVLVGLAVSVDVGRIISVSESSLKNKMKSEVKGQVMKNQLNIEVLRNVQL
jgi:hypothetical protein